MADNECEREQHAFCAHVASDLCGKPDIQKQSTAFFNRKGVIANRSLRCVQQAYKTGFQYGLTEGLFLVLSGQVDITYVIREKLERDSNEDTENTDSSHHRRF